MKNPIIVFEVPTDLVKGLADRSHLIPVRRQTKKGHMTTVYIRPVGEEVMEGTKKKPARAGRYFIKDLNFDQVKKLRENPEALEEFFKTNDRLVGSMIRNRILRIYPHKPRMPLHNADAQQAGRLALWKALKEYDPKTAYSDLGRLASFGTYAYSWLRNELNNFYYPKKAKKRGGTGSRAGEEPKSLHDVVSSSGDSTTTLADTVPEDRTVMSPEEGTVESMEAQAVKRALKKLEGMLTGTPKKIVQGLAAGKTKAEMSRKLGISRAAVTMALQKKVYPHWAEMKRMIDEPGKASLKSLVQAVLKYELLKAFDGVPVKAKTISRAGETLLKSLDKRVQFRPRFVFRKGR